MSYFTLRIITILMEIIKDLYISIHPLPIPGVGVCTGRLRPPRAGWPRPAARAAGDAQGDAREPAAWELRLNEHLAHAEKGSNLNIGDLAT